MSEESPAETTWIDADKLAQILGRGPPGAQLNFTEAAALAGNRPFQHQSDGTTLILVDKKLAEVGRAITGPELRELLMAIKEAGMIGLHPDAVAGPDEQPLIVALGTIAGLASMALEGHTLPPQRLEVDEAMWRRLTHGEPVVLHTNLGYRVELLWPRRV